eukprot:TRINITY_DN15038_c0_g1_i7.p1 TRINITY_DN15038_c0_g1~~TRINITY_DN15038_c0_g1_i7.p1  ORF type:complete len:813 (+),score=184.97 TRINITY_DN15038_c0_g1_i7:72-2510(+)
MPAPRQTSSAAEASEGGSEEAEEEEREVEDDEVPEESAASEVAVPQPRRKANSLDLPPKRNGNGKAVESRTAVKLEQAAEAQQQGAEEAAPPKAKKPRHCLDLNGLSASRKLSDKLKGGSSTIAAEKTANAGKLARQPWEEVIDLSRLDQLRSKTLTAISAAGGSVGSTTAAAPRKAMAPSRNGGPRLTAASKARLAAPVAVGAAEEEVDDPDLPTPTNQSIANGHTSVRLRQQPNKARLALLRSAGIKAAQDDEAESEEGKMVNGGAEDDADASEDDSDHSVERLQRAKQESKRSRIAPYAPPHIKQRQEEEAMWEHEKTEWKRRLAEEDEAGGPVVERQIGPNIRKLAREWEPRLEEPGTCCFNPLQCDSGVDVDEGGIWAECTSLPPPGPGLAGHATASTEDACACTGPGLKVIPAVAGGRYQFEVELLRDSSVVIGWSAAISLPSGFDTQAFGYGPEGRLEHGGEADRVAYGPAFGRKGDIIGACVEWPAGQTSVGGGPARAPAGSPIISYALNGRYLGEAFDLASFESCAGGSVPLQPHICQAGREAFEVLLRGASEDAPLKHPIRTFRPLGECLDSHFCAFSSAVARAKDARMAALLDADALQDFQLPDGNIVELVYESQGAGAMGDIAVEKRLFRLLRLSSGADAAGGSSGGRPAPDLLAVRRTGAGTALVAFKLAAHATRCVNVFGQSRKQAHGMGAGIVALEPPFRARQLRDASQESRQLLTDWRGEDFREPGQTPTVARRLPWRLHTLRTSLKYDLLGSRILPMTRLLWRWRLFFLSFAKRVHCLLWLPRLTLKSIPWSQLS